MRQSKMHNENERPGQPMRTASPLFPDLVKTSADDDAASSRYSLYDSDPDLYADEWTPYFREVSRVKEQVAAWHKQVNELAEDIQIVTEEQQHRLGLKRLGSFDLSKPHDKTPDNMYFELDEAMQALTCLDYTLDGYQDQSSRHRDMSPSKRLEEARGWCRWMYKARRQAAYKGTLPKTQNVSSSCDHRVCGQAESGDEEEKPQGYELMHMRRHGHSNHPFMMGIVADGKEANGDEMLRSELDTAARLMLHLSKYHNLGLGTFGAVLVLSFQSFTQARFTQFHVDEQTWYYRQSRLLSFTNTREGHKDLETVMHWYVPKAVWLTYTGRSVPIDEVSHWLKDRNVSVPPSVPSPDQFLQPTEKNDQLLARGNKPDKQAQQSTKTKSGFVSSVPRPGILARTSEDYGSVTNALQSIGNRERQPRHMAQGDQNWQGSVNRVKGRKMGMEKGKGKEEEETKDTEKSKVGKEGKDKEDDKEKQDRQKHLGSRRLRPPWRY